MNKNKRTLFGLFFILAASISGAEQQVTLSTGEWLPFQSETLKHGGVAAHIVTQSLRSQGIQVELAYYPRKRGYKLAKNGEVNGTFLRSKKPERLEHFLYSDPIVSDLPVVFFKKENPINWEEENWLSLSGKRIGATLGYTYLADFQKLEESNQIQVER